MNKLVSTRVTELVVALRREELSPHDLLDALENRIHEVDDRVNALPTLCFARAREAADRLLKLPVAQRGILCGLPVPIKDLENVDGVRTTMGSLIYSDHVPDSSDYIVQRLEAQGAIVYAKSNTPEFGAGANTFNEVFGATRNPHDLSKSAAGSSGGAAAALASGTAWLAQGSDNAGSLRNPASFCGVVGMRPSPGRVPIGPSVNPYDTLSVLGPMARNVEDLALFLDAMGGLDERDPLSFQAPTTSFLEAARARHKPARVAYSANLGITPVDPRVSEVCSLAAQRFEAMGVAVEKAQPDLSGLSECYQVLRAYEYALSSAELLEEHRDKLKPEVIGNIEKGQKLTNGQVMQAVRARGEFRKRFEQFFTEYDLLLTPTTIVPPYPVEQRYVERCNGVEFDSYIDWLAIAYAVSLVSLPALSLPCGYTDDGLPVGLQVIGRSRGEAEILAAALLLEENLQLDLHPVEPAE